MTHKSWSIRLPPIHEWILVTLLSPRASILAKCTLLGTNWTYSYRIVLAKQHPHLPDAGQVTKASKRTWANKYSYSRIMDAIPMSSLLSLTCWQRGIWLILMIIGCRWRRLTSSSRSATFSRNVMRRHRSMRWGSSIREWAVTPVTSYNYSRSNTTKL